MIRLHHCVLGALVLIPPLAEGADRTQAATGAAMPAASPTRVLPLQGGRNFRDLGGYAARDGRHVKWGLLFRSGSMSGLTATDYAYLEQRGIRVVCDLRDRRERRLQPMRWPDANAPRVLFEDYQLDIAAFMPAGAPSSWTGAGTRAATTASYPVILDRFNGQYRRMFAELLAGNAPLAFNCSAGKDRTGIAAALILTALGVPRRTVIEDYLLTNRYLDRGEVAHGPPPANMAPSAGDKSDADLAAAFRAVPPEAMRAFLVADRSYIEAALGVLDRHRGGAEGYLRERLGLDHAALVRLRSLYLE